MLPGRLVQRALHQSPGRMTAGHMIRCALGVCLWVHGYGSRAWCMDVQSPKHPRNSWLHFVTEPSAVHDAVSFRLDQSAVRLDQSVVIDKQVQRMGPFCSTATCLQSCPSSLPPRQLHHTASHCIQLSPPWHEAWLQRRHSCHGLYLPDQ